MRKAIRGLLLVAVVIGVGVSVLAQGADEAGEDATLASQYVTEITTAPYTDWAPQPNVPAGFYVGSEPHGMILRVFVNDVVVGDTPDGVLTGDTYSDGAILVKENHMAGDVDVRAMTVQAPVPEFEGDLAALTFMVKIAGYNPEAGDWFWVRSLPDGTIDKAGRLEGCIACHSQAVDGDYVFNIPAAD